jgi:hypothetical protein
MDGHNGIEPVILAAEERLGLKALNLGAEGIQIGAQLAQDVLSFPGQLEVGSQVGELPRQAIVNLERCFKTLSLSQNLLGSCGVLPKLWMSYLFLDGFDFAACLGRVKENS